MNEHHLSQYSNEQEVLFNPLNVFKVKKINKADENKNENIN